MLFHWILITRFHRSSESSVRLTCVQLEQSFPRLGSLRGCERAHVLVVRACMHLASVRPRVEKKSARMKAVDISYQNASALLRKRDKTA